MIVCLSAADQVENPLIAALVAVAVVSLVVIAVLSGLLARFVYLYFKRRRSSSDFGDGHYSRYAAVGKFINKTHKK